jgi:FkbM family methyltransferase
MYTTALAKVGRFYPFFSGNFRLVNYSMLARFFASKNSLAWCPSPGGQILVPLNDEVGRCIYFTGDYDRKITWVCRKLLRQGDTAIDIGANLGVVTLAMARFVGLAGQVHAFEPNPILHNLIEKSLRRNATTNVMLHNLALGSENGELQLSVPEGNSGQGSLTNHYDSPGSSYYRCRVRRLSEIVSQSNLTRIRLMKIDVEGFENEVLIGATDVLRHIRPSAIVLETNEQNRPPFRERAAVKTLVANDFRFFSLPKALISMKARQFDADIVDDPSHDVVAVPAEMVDEIARLLA